MQLCQRSLRLIGQGTVRRHGIYVLALSMLVAIGLLIGALSGSITPAPASDAPVNMSPDIKTIVESIDRIFRSQSSRGRMQMSVVTPEWTRTMSMDIWSEGMDKTFIRITGPAKDRGIATLRLENEMWNFFPNINKVMKVPPSMMMSSWMGSDFTNDDLVKESSLLRDYEARLLEPQEPGHYYVELKPLKDSPIVWGRIVAKVRRADYIPVLEEYYDERGELMRVITLSDIKPMGGRTVPTLMELVPMNKQGRKTIIRYSALEFDIPLESDVFSLRNLQRLPD